MDPRLILQSLGLDQKQCESYLALLELGSCSISELAKRAHLKRPTTYLAVHELQMKGLVSEILVGKRRRYSAVHPRRLHEIARLRERQTEAALPELVALHNAPKEKPKIQVLEGKQGVVDLYRDLYQSLGRKEEALFYTRIDAFANSIPTALEDFKQMLRDIPKPRIRELNFGNEAGEKWSQEIKPFMAKNPNHRMRLLPTDFEMGATDNLIFGSKLNIFSLKKSIFVTVIESEDIANTYRTLFEWGWRAGKEVSL